MPLIMAMNNGGDQYYRAQQQSYFMLNFDIRKLLTAMFNGWFVWYVWKFSTDYGMTIYLTR